MKRSTTGYSKRYPLAGPSLGDAMVAFVVPARNEAAHMAQCLASIKVAAAQAEMAVEVVVVDDDSSDRTGAVAREHGARVVTQRPHRGQLAAWARGVESTAAPVVVFFDADCEMDPAALRPLIAPFSSDRVGVVASRSVPLPSAGRAGLVGRSARFSAALLDQVKRRLVDHDFLPIGRMMAVRRTAWAVEDLDRPYNDRVVAHEAKLKGWRIIYQPAAVVRYLPPLAFPELEADFRRTRAPLGFDADALPKLRTFMAMTSALGASPMNGVAWLLCQVRLSRSAQGRCQPPAPARWDPIRQPSDTDGGTSP